MSRTSDSTSRGFSQSHRTKKRRPIMLPQALEGRLLMSADHEPDDSFTQAYTPPNNIYLEQNYQPTGTVTAGGDGNDYFKFYNLYGPSHLYAALDALSADADVHVYDQNQNLLASSTLGGNASETINVDLPGNQYFYVRVNAFSGSTNYSLFLYNDYAGSTLSTARDIGTTWGQGSDKFWPYNKIFTNDYLDYRDNVDYVKFQMEAPGTISLRQQPVNNDPGALVDNMQLLDSSGSVLANGLSDAGGAFNLDRFSATAGTYYVKFTQISGSGTYNYRIVGDYAGDVTGTARNLGDVTNSSREDYDMVGGPSTPASYADAIDLYKFTLSQTSPLDITLADAQGTVPPVFGANLQLAQDTNGDGTIESGEVFNQITGGNGGAIHATLAAGTYYINVMPAPNAAYTSYQLDLDSDPDAVTGDPKGYANMTKATNAGTLSGESFQNGGFGQRPGGDISDFYKFTMSAPGTLLASAQLNPFYSRSAYAPTLAVIRDTNNNGYFDPGENLAPFTATTLQQTLAAGTYYLEVANDGEQEAFQLRMVSDYAGNSLPAARPMAAISGANPPTQSFKDYAEENFGPSSDFLDFYTFTLPSAYTTTLKSNGVSGEDLSMALIKDANNNGVIDSGDIIASSNVANSPNESITRTLGAGKYFVRMMGVNGGCNYSLSATFAASSLAPFAPVRINAGGPAFADSLLNLWQADSGFAGGTVSTSAFSVAGTSDDALYYDRRAGTSFTFARTVPSGQYTVKLLFADPTSTASGQRKFNVFSEGTKVISSLDLVASAGVKHAYSKIFAANVSDGVLNLSFQGVVGSALVSGISIIRSDRPTVHVNAGGGSYTDTYGNAWSPDSGFAGGTTSVSGAAIAGTFDDALFSSYRFGSSFTFSKSVANGSYQLRLLFEDPTATAAGQRKFNVSAQGTTILSNFDLFAAAGANKKAVARTFTVNVTNGALSLKFTGVVGNAIVSGIELLPV
jgi:hypothetical protein